MSLSIFNFKNNIREFDKVSVLGKLIFVSFCVFFTLTLHLFISYGISRYKLFILYSVVVSSILLFHRAGRAQYWTIVIGSILFLLVGEVFFRVTYFGPAGVNHFLQYVPAGLGSPLSSVQYDRNSSTGLIPSSDWIFKGAPFRVNNLGFVGNDILPDKPKDTTRIVVLGTSVSMGSGVRYEENYSSQLEELLTDYDAGKKYEVVNLAVGAYGAEDYLDVMGKYFPLLSPDIVLIEGNMRVWRKKGLHPKKPFAGNILERIKIALERPYELFFFFQIIKEELTPTFAHYANEFLQKFVFFKKEQKEAEDNFIFLHNNDKKILRGTFEKIRQLCAGKQVYIVWLRHIQYLNKPPTKKHALEAVCKEFSFGYIDTSFANYGTNEKDLIIYPGDRHSNSKGHRVYAETIFDALTPLLNVY